jgi:long-chain acyl-CoA synthetase
LVLKITQVLRSRFPTTGFKIGLWGENRVEWCALAIATWNAGGTLVPLMHIATDSEIKNIISAAKIDGLFISPKLEKNQDYGVKDTFLMDFTQTRGQGALRSLGDLLSELRATPANPKSSTASQPEKFKEDKLAILIFTSGTTGHPKGVMLTHKNIISNIIDTFDVFPTDETDRAVSVLPLSHLFELVGGFTIAHVKGICISYPESLKPEDVLGEMASQKATLLVAVPLFFEIIDRAIQERVRKMSNFTQQFIAFMGGVVFHAPFLGPIIFKKIHAVFGGHIRYFVTGGAKIDPDIILRFKRLGIHFLQGYGLTETSPIISFTSLKHDKYGSVGRPVPSVKVKIVDGEICVSGDNVFKGYFENPEATAQVIENGWFHTGDIGHLDEENFLFITGRKKDIIVTPNGKNIYPEELEEALRQSPLIQEVAVIGVDTGRGEEVHAVIVPTSVAPREPAAQRQAIWTETEKICANFSEYKRIRGITVTREELPKTATKKVRKHVLKEMLAKSSFKEGVTPDGAHTPLNIEFEREVWLNERLQLITKRPDIWREAHLRQDLGIDSLTFMELVSAIETHWGVQILDEDFDKILTVDDLLTYLGKSAPKEGAATKAKVEFDYRLNNRFMMRALRLLLHGIFIRPLMKLFFRFKISNSQIFAQTKNWIATPNHASHLDLLSVLGSVPLSRLNGTYAVAADDYFFNNPMKAYFVRLLFNAIPFERRARIDTGFKICEEILREGGNLIIFPEGTRSPTGQLSEFKPGVGRLLASHSYSAIPVYIRGAHEAFPKGAAMPTPHPISVYVGQPLKFVSSTADVNGYQNIALKLHDAVKDLGVSAVIKPASL